MSSGIIPTITEIRERLDTFLPEDHTETTRAAVAAILREGNEHAEILFIKRADQIGDPWSGHMAFPGGWIEADDESARHAAERETIEEIGLDLTRHALFVATLNAQRPLMPIPGRTTSIAPFVYILNSEPETYELNEEVAELHWGDIGSMLRHQNLTSLEWNIDEQSRTMPGFDVNGRTVWGLTFRILVQLLSVIQPGYQAPP